MKHKIVMTNLYNKGINLLKICDNKKRAMPLPAIAHGTHVGSNPNA